MLPTFVIGLREGLEAALIVGIIAAFLRRQGRRDLLLRVGAGVGIAVLLCALVGLALEAYSRQLPQRQQEGLETVIGALAVAMVTYMIVWMRRHSRELKGQLESLAADAISSASNAGRAMVVMAFLAVIREGFETVVFLLAAFNESGSGAAAGAGAALGIVVAVALGYGIYRGGVRLNLSRFFRATGLVLVLVAAGLVVNALHTAHEAGWLDLGQGGTVDLSRLVQPGTVQASLLTGMLGLQPHPVAIEVIGWLAYLLVVGCYVAWPAGRAVPRRVVTRGCTALATVAVAAAVALVLAAPARPAQRPVTGAGELSAKVVGREDGTVEVTTGGTHYRLTSTGIGWHRGLSTERFRAHISGGSAAATLPRELTPVAVARLNAGRLPIGLTAGSGVVPVSYEDVGTLTVWLDARIDRVVDLVWSERVAVTAHRDAAAYPLALPAAVQRRALPDATVAAAVAAARGAHDALDRRALLHRLAALCAVLAGLALAAVLRVGVAGRRERDRALDHVAAGRRLPVRSVAP